MGNNVWECFIHRLQELDYRGIVGPYLHCEPLADPYAFRRADDLHTKTKAWVVFVTNGSYLKKRIADISARPWIQWYVSIPTVDDYHSFTGLDMDEVVSSMKAMKDACMVPIVLSAVGSRLEADQVITSLPWFTPGVDLFFSPRDSRAGHTTDRFYRLSIPGAIETIRYADYCIHPWAFVNVDLSGNVLGCCQDWSHDMIVGNILHSSFQDIYDGERAYNLREQISNGSYMYPRCTVCKEELEYK